MSPQPGILAPVPPVARYLALRLLPDVDPRPALKALAEADGEAVVVGLGHSLVSALGADVGLTEAPSLAGPGISVPSTPIALWLWLRGDDRGALVHAGQAWTDRLAPAFARVAVVDAFTHAGGRDLSGYEDGTENPVGGAATEVALVDGAGPGRDGGSFVAVQRWVHDLRRFHRMSADAQDATIGRRRSDNAELADAPPSAHVRRTAQESFTPPAFMLRRSMPWADADGEGLVFVAFGRSFDAFDAAMRRMVGLEDGVVDALFRFTRPVETAYLWCPPVAGGRLDLSALG